MAGAGTRVYWSVGQGRVQRFALPSLVKMNGSQTAPEAISGAVWLAGQPGGPAYQGGAIAGPWEETAHL